MCGTPVGAPAASPLHPPRMLSISPGGVGEEGLGWVGLGMGFLVWFWFGLVLVGILLLHTFASDVHVCTCQCIFLAEKNPIYLCFLLCYIPGGTGNQD